MLIFFTEVIKFYWLMLLLCPGELYRLLGASSLFWNDVSFVPVRVLHKDEKILGRKHIYLPHAQTTIYDSMVKLFLKQGISHQLGRDAVVRFECENSAIDVIINFLWKIFHKSIVLVVLTTANFGGFSNFCRYYTRSQTGKSTGYRPTLKSLVTGANNLIVLGLRRWYCIWMVGQWYWICIFLLRCTCQSGRSQMSLTSIS